MFSETLEKGDLILIANSNRLTPSIFKKFGSAGNIQYYNLWTGNGWRDEECVEWYKGVIYADKKNPYTSYINTTHKERYAKISTEFLNPELANTYRTVKQLLIDNNYLK